MVIDYLGDNVANGMILLERAIAHNVEKFVLSSTANLFSDAEIPISECVPVIPGSPYGESKFFLERTLYWLEVIYGLKYAVLRYFNVAGAYGRHGEDHNPETHLIPLILQVALGQREEISIFGDDYPTYDGTCIRDYVHVYDLAQAHILSMRALDNGSRTYNLGNGRGFSVREIIDTARRLTGREIKTVITQRRNGDPAVLVASSAKIQRELGWYPRYPQIDEIIGSAWEWHQRHPLGYKDNINSI